MSATVAVFALYSLMVPGVCWEVMEGRGGVVRNGGVGAENTWEVELQVVAGK
nr:hypothetical protein [Tanacetum cinerariifolium]GFA09577.1 hypothetical protein [Tanacetum cinerariifolium]